MPSYLQKPIMHRIMENLVGDLYKLICSICFLIHCINFSNHVVIIRIQCIIMIQLVTSAMALSTWLESIQSKTFFFIWPALLVYLNILSIQIIFFGWQVNLFNPLKKLGFIIVVGYLIRCWWQNFIIDKIAVLSCSLAIDLSIYPNYTIIQMDSINSLHGMTPMPCGLCWRHNKHTVIQNMGNYSFLNLVHLQK